MMDGKLRAWLLDHDLGDWMQNFRALSYLKFEDLEGLRKQPEIVAKLIPKDMPRVDFMEALEKLFPDPVAPSPDEPAAQIKSQECWCERQKAYYDDRVLLDPAIVHTYTPRRVIGGGGGGTSIELGKLDAGITFVPIAVKSIPLPEGVRPEDVIRECEMMNKLEHKNIVKTFGMYFSTDDCAQVVLEYMSMGDLHTYRCKHSFPAKLKVRALMHIASGMKYAHAAGIAHRCLSLENVLVGDYSLGTVIFKLLLFVLLVRTHFFSCSKHSSPLCGPQQSFVAPEVGDVDYDPLLSDVYSYGILMWHVWTGAFPYSDSNGCEDLHGEKLLARIREQHQLRPNLQNEGLNDMPDELKEVMQLCWDEDPTKRPRTFKAILKVLKTVRLISAKDDGGPSAMVKM